MLDINLIKFPEVTKDLKRWYRIRDTLLNDNGKKYDLTVIKNLSSQCDYHEAKWLNGLINKHQFPNSIKDVKSLDKIIDIFKNETDEDYLGASSCFAALFIIHGYNHISSPHYSNNYNNDVKPLIKISLNKGYTLSLLYYSSTGCRTDQDIGYDSIFQAAKQNERQGFYFLGRHYLLKKNDLAQKFYLQAAKMDCVYSQYIMSEYCTEIVDKVKWLFKSMKGGNCYMDKAPAVSKTYVYVSSFIGGEQRLGPVIYQIGKGYQNEIDMVNKTLFGMKAVYPNFNGLENANFANQFYVLNRSKCKDAVVCWCLIGKRLGIYKDLRLMIGKMIWKTKRDALYDVCDFVAKYKETIKVMVL